MYANAAPLFGEKGFKMTAVSTGKTRGNFVHRFEEAGIDIIHRPLSLGYKSPFVLLRYFRQMYKYIKKERVDVVHIHRPDIFWYYAVCAFLAGKKTIVTPHNVFKNRKITWPKAYLERMTARRFFKTTFQTIGESVYNNELIYYKNPSIKINNWYDASRFFPPHENERTSVRAELGIHPDEFVIISVGSCSPVKNHADILTALPIVQKNMPCLYLHLGSGSSEEEEKKKAITTGQQTHVRFLGNQMDVRKYLVAADIFIMPSRFEGLSIAAIEAMACGLPGILYNAPGLVDLIKNNDNGFLINPSPELMAEKIIFFQNNRAVIREKGNNALRFVNENFNMPKSVCMISELYRK